MDLKQLLKKRRSFRDYTQKPISNNLIFELIESSADAPISCNLQLTQYVVIDNPELLKKLAENVSYKFKYSPCFIIVLQDSRFSVERQSGVMSAGMAVENILLRATDLGLATCAMSGFENDDFLKKTLSIPKHVNVLLIISVGYVADSNVGEIPKIPIEKRFNMNSYGDLKTMNDSPSLKNHSIRDIIDYRSRIAPVYLDRFRLNTYDPSYYEDAFNFFKENALSKKSGGTILDLISYDGIFLKILHDNHFESKYKIIASDYLENNLNFFKKEFGVNVSQISESNTLSLSKESVDFVSFIFQAPFTPKLKILIKDVSRLMNPDGRFLVALVRESVYKRFGKFIKSSYQKFILKKNFNIYENNPFYRIGPKSNISNNEIIRLCAECGLVPSSEVVSKKHAGNGIKIDFLTFRKS